MSDIRPAARGAEDDPAGCTANDDLSTAGAPPRATTGVSTRDGAETPSYDIAPAVAPAAAPAAVLTAAAGATIAYTAATARSAATALVRMLLREGVFAAAGGESRNDGSGDSSDGGLNGGLNGAPGSSGAGASGEPGAGEPDGWDRMRAVVALAEARRAEVPGLRLAGEAVARTAARRHPVRAVPAAPAAPLK
ncbi:hypothetical protein [Streptomyces katsurahamanus]|uniref:Uncharacterized protein n=1 Tax=Streptomyces katsurahamanus TaxID=2577098 RepID=A0ABW9NN70_9ACTN|nr:hypothetical protein [Streptomyces katsurahamanus]MQS34733.1 hypothetical protein [Streptomyces katsurahamanus]